MNSNCKVNSKSLRSQIWLRICLNARNVREVKVLSAKFISSRNVERSLMRKDSLRNKGERNSLELEWETMALKNQKPFKEDKEFQRNKIIISMLLEKEIELKKIMEI